MVGNVGSGNMNSNKDNKISKGNIIHYGKREQQKQRHQEKIMHQKKEGLGHDLGHFCKQTVEERLGSLKDIQISVDFL